MKIYIDGVVSSSRVADSRSDASNDNIITIGAGAAGYFNGTIDEVSVWNKSLTSDEIYQLYISNLNKYDSDKWALYVNQSKNASDGLGLGDYTYQTFVTNQDNNPNQTEERTITIESSTCPSSPRNWKVNMIENLITNSLCNLTGYNLTFSGVGEFTVNNTLYVDGIKSLSSGIPVWVKPDGLIYSGAK